MAALVAVSSASSLAVPASAPVLRASSHSSKASKIAVRKMSNFGGLRPENQVARLGCLDSTELQFARVVTRCFAASGVPKGGAASSSCDAGSLIFKVVPIMSALTLVGVALGFVLLRIEAAVEESE